MNDEIPHYKHCFSCEELFNTDELIDGYCFTCYDKEGWNE